jgi:hypothetical protein
VRRVNIAGCVPLAGRGLVARRGSLVTLTDARTPGLEPLLGTLAEVTNAHGDGNALVLAVMRAALACEGRAPSWACAGLTSDGQVTVLVHGEAVALVSFQEDPETEVTARGSIVPVARTFAGGVMTVRLVVDALTAAAAPDPRLWLGEGTISGGGVLLNFVHTGSHRPLPGNLNAPTAAVTREDLADVTAVQPRAWQQGMGQSGQEAYLPSDQPTLRTWSAAAEESDFAALAPAAGGPSPDDAFAYPAGPDPQTPSTLPYTENWFSQEPPQAPTLRMTRTDGLGNDGVPTSLIADVSTMELVRLGPVEPVAVDGVLCERKHFNAPDATLCRACGGSVHSIPRNMRRQPRPPLGVLLIDDGRGYPLDRDFVIGREPVLDGDVAAGRATPLQMSDAEGSVSRLHLRISLVGWQVEVHDLCSSNGSVLYQTGIPRTLAPMEAAVLDPGARVDVGKRAVQFLPYSLSPR